MMNDDLFSKLHPRLVKKINRMANQVTRKTQQQDALFIVEGSTGSGKTTASAILAACLSILTKRTIHLFFRAKDMIDFAKRTEDQIIIWDEPALDSLGTDVLTKLNRDLFRLFFTIRANRHVFIINFTDFTRFSPYLTVERPCGLIHLQKGRVGHGMYISYKRLPKLRQSWDDYRKRTYLKCKSYFLDFPLIKPETFAGFDITVNNVPHCTLEMLDRMKKESVAMIGEGTDDKSYNTKLKLEIKKLKYLISTEPKGLITWDERAKHYKTDRVTLMRWKNAIFDNQTGIFMGDVPVFEGGGGAGNVKTWGGPLGGRPAQSEEINEDDE